MKRVSIAPMMDITNRHFRYLMRLISREIWLYTEMITPGAIVHGDRERILGFHGDEHPLALQLGGSDPKLLAIAAKIAEQHGYDEINLNVGCPSDRVQAGAFGACLMKQPDLVAECVAEIKAHVHVPVTVKTRIGVDEFDSLDFLLNFVEKVQASGCEYFIIHARKAWLKGLSPRQNREVPPLDYSRAFEVKKAFPQLGFELNGGIQSLEDLAKCSQFDGVMLGRIAQNNAYLTVQMAQQFLELDTEIPAQAEILKQYLQYGFDQLQQGNPFTILVKPLFSLFQGMHGAKQWRKKLSDIAVMKTDGEARWELIAASATNVD